MPTHHPPRPSYLPDTEPLPGESDTALAVSLRTPSWSVDPYPLAVLLERHWEPVHDYAVLCAALTGVRAPALAAAAVHQVLKGLGRPGPAEALRPRLLTAVRRTAEAWAADRRTARPVAGAQAPGLADPPGRQLASTSFWALPPAGQCLLWHTAVEAEPVSVPAALLALDIGSALTELEQARGQFGAGLLRIHAELSASAVCRFYSRLLDAHTRRGRAFPPDVRQHLQDCPDCGAAAEQLGMVERRLGELLAQALLGGPAGDYLASRPGRTGPGAGEGPPAAPSPRTGRPRRPGRHRLPPDAEAPGRGPAPSVRGHARVLLTGVGLASALALGAVLTSTLWPVGEVLDAPRGPEGPAAARTDAGGTGGTDGAGGTAVRQAVPPTPSSSTWDTGPAAYTGPAGASPGGGPHDASAGRCPDVRGGRAEQAAGAPLSVYASAAQGLRCREDGPPCGPADRALCLPQPADGGVLHLGGCTDRSAGAESSGVRHDPALRGGLLARGVRDPAAAPAAPLPGADVPAKVRDGSAEQRWLREGVPLRSRTVPGAGALPLDAPPPRHGTGCGCGCGTTACTTAVRSGRG
ncbi:hydrolase [Streptomyces sulfonofaciens]|uniref:Hydrolase n=1 Tax=Streptomyces sulfonofaciens TaxID=68272 RepID=A0A919FWC5_9ACTN|nr:hydrolase [Streptomyces sulfonofaciens]GHH73278.1 hydrolase [Streptomyces sulfonofaciens]